MSRRVIFFGLLVAHLVLLLNLQYTVWPEMVLYPYLLNHGYKLYTDIVNPYFPLLPLFLGLIFKAFGQSVLAIKVFTYILILSADCGVFYIARRLSNNFWRAAGSLLVYILLQISFEGNGLWFELALTPVLLFSFSLLYFKRNKWGLIWSGILLGLAVLIKQNAALFFLPALLLISTDKKREHYVYFLVPPFLLGVLMIAWVYINGIFSDFVDWTIKLPSSFTHQPGFVLLPSRTQELLMLFLILPLLFLLRKLKSKTLFWLLIFGISLIFAFPRYEAFHLQILVAFSAVLVSLLDKKILGFFGLAALIILLRDARVTLKQPDRFLDKSTFQLAEEISYYPDVYLLNTPELSYFFANKLPPKPWATNFPWYYENTDIGQRVDRYLKDHPDEVVVIGQKSGGGKFELGNYLPGTLADYINKDYTLDTKEGNLEIWKRRSTK